MRRFRYWSIFLLIFYVTLTAMLYFLQEKLIFLPTTLDPDFRYEFNAPFEEVFLESPDGARLNAIHFKVENPRGLVLYFHGNAGDLSRWGNIVSLFPELGYDALVMDYRTYGKSTGKLSPEALLGDARLFYDYSLQRYSEEDIILYGRSLGSGLACFLAANNDPRMVLLESPYYSLRSLAKKRFPFLPVDLLLKYHLDSNEYVQSIDCPVGIFHGDQDAVIPIESGQALYKAMPEEQSAFFEIIGGKHNDLDSFPEYYTRLKEVLSGHVFDPTQSGSK